MSCEKRKRGQMLNLNERNVVLEVLDHYLETMNKSKAVESCSEATGRSPRMIYKLAKEREQGELKPPKRSKRPHVKSHMRIMKYKSDVRSCIRRIVHSCFIQNIPPTLHTILETVNAIDLFSPFKRGTLYNLLRDMGFEYEKRRGRGIFVENKDILSYRHKYLQKIKEAREQNKTIIYTGELWLDMANIWKEEPKEPEHSQEQKSSNEVSPVLVLVHAGFMHGFIEGAKLTLLCKTDRTDVREEMNCEIYENWFFNQFLPLCPKSSIIVMDSAKYNSQKVGNVPNCSWPKDDIIEWLESTGIEVDSTLPIPQLMDLVDGTKDDHDIFKIDHECENLGFEVLRPPPNHRELNPIYMVWDQIEYFLKAGNSRLKKDVLELIDESYSTVSTDDWLNYVTETQSNEEFLWQADCLQENIESLIKKLKWTRHSPSQSCLKFVN